MKLKSEYLNHMRYCYLISTHNITIKTVIIFSCAFTYIAANITNILAHNMRYAQCTHFNTIRVCCVVLILSCAVTYAWYCCLY